MTAFEKVAADDGSKREKDSNDAENIHRSPAHHSALVSADPISLSGRTRSAKLLCTIAAGMP